MELQTIGIVLTALLAFCGYVATYINNKSLERIRSQISLVNLQLEKLYGPLLALAISNSNSWKEFRSHHREGKPYFDDNDPPTVQEVKAFRHWMTVVFLPANYRMVDIISNNAHLVEGSSMPQSFLDFLAHVRAYQAIASLWKDEDASMADFIKADGNVSLTNIPANFDNDVQNTFDTLKERQSNLLKIQRKKRRSGGAKIPSQPTGA